MKIAALAGFAVLGTLLATACASASSLGQLSDHYDGSRFHNRPPTPSPDLGDLMKVSWELWTKGKNWPDAFKTPELEKLDATEEPLRIVPIGHSTVLIQVDGLNILTDPIFSEVAGPNRFVGFRRVTNPAMAIEKLPSIDVILISHNHYDHLDIDSIQRIASRQKSKPPRILVGLGVSDLLKSAGIANVFEMDWDDSTSIGQTKIHFLEAIHTSARGPFDRDKTLWGAFLVQSSVGNIYFAGDTAYGHHFKQVRERFGPTLVSLLPIAAYKPRWFMSKSHIDPEEAVLAHLDLESKQSIAIHFGYFDSAEEGFEEPVRDLHEAMRRHNLRESDFLVPKPDQPFTTGLRQGK